MKVVDCGDIPVTPVDNALALRQMTLGLATLGGRKPANKDVMEKVRLVSLGGDHSIALSALRALSNIYGREKIVVVHFDAHLDTWSADKYPNVWNEGGQENMGWFNHGSMFRLAFQEGLISKKKNVHAGLRTRLSSAGDWEEDDSQGWLRISTEDIDDIGTKGIIEKILERVGEDVPVYLSFDIDVVDPGVCPGTGTPEPGGWTSREVLRILRGITAKLNVVGADVVEVAPAYDGVGEQTSLVAAQVVYEIVSGMVSKLRREKEGRGKWKDRDEL